MEANQGLEPLESLFDYSSDSVSADNSQARDRNLEPSCCPRRPDCEEELMCGVAVEDCGRTWEHID